MHVLDANIRMHLLMMMITSFVFFTLHCHTCNLVPLLQLSMDVVCMCGFV